MLITTNLLFGSKVVSIEVSDLSEMTQLCLLVSDNLELPTSHNFQKWSEGVWLENSHSVDGYHIYI